MYHMTVYTVTKTSFANKCKNTHLTQPHSPWLGTWVKDVFTTTITKTPQITRKQENNNDFHFWLIIIIIRNSYIVLVPNPTRLAQSTLHIPATEYDYLCQFGPLFSYLLPKFSSFCLQYHPSVIFVGVHLTDFFNLSCTTG